MADVLIDFTVVASTLLPILGRGIEVK